MRPEGIAALAITVGDIENEAMELEQVERKGMNKPYFERIDYDLSMPLARQVRLPSRSVVKHQRLSSLNRYFAGRCSGWRPGVHCTCDGAAAAAKGVTGEGRETRSTGGIACG